MVTKMLKRRTTVCLPHPVPSTSDDCSEVVATATKVLGYKPTSDNEGMTTKDKVVRSNAIREVLMKLDDPPFTQKSVDRYKRKMHRCSMHRGEWFAEHVCFSSAVICGIGFLAFLVITVGLGIAGSEVMGVFGLTCLSCAIGGVIVVIVGCIASPKRTAGTNTVLIMTQTTWDAVWIEDYHKAIPEFVLQTAVDLKEKFGDDIRFSIEELKVTREEVIIAKNDPFLRADLPDGSIYYLEVWNEPTFAGKRIA